MRGALLAPIACCMLLFSAVSGAAQTNALYIDSEPGDRIANGVDSHFTAADGVFLASGWRSVQATFEGQGAWWSLTFTAAIDSELTVGVYERATNSPFSAGTGLSVFALGGGCSEATGRFAVLEIERSGPTVTRFAADFEYHCLDEAPGLFGAIRINSTIGAVVPFGGEYPRYELTITPSAHGRVTAAAGLDCGQGAGNCVLTLPSPATIALTATPAPGYTFAGWDGYCTGYEASVALYLNHRKQCEAIFAAGGEGTTAVHIDSEAGDAAGLGVQQTFVPPAASFALTPGARHGVSLRVDSSTTDWWFELAGPLDKPLEPGLYPAFQYANLPMATMHASSTLGGCQVATGRFVVLEAVYRPDGSVLRFAADLEQHCGDAVPALFAAIRYRSTVTSIVPFDGDYPRYELSVVRPQHGRVVANGIDCGVSGNCQLMLSNPETVSLTAQADPGYVFAGWGDDCRGFATTTLLVNGSKKCAVWFEPAAGSDPRSVLLIDSQPGDPIGGGARDVYSPHNSIWSIGSSDGTSVGLIVTGALRQWTIDIRSEDGRPLAVGSYDAVYQNGPFNGLSISTPGNACLTPVVGRFRILDIAFANGALTRFSADFEQHCGDGAPGLFGAIRHNSSIDDLRPFGGDYPRYELSIAPSAAGVVTGAGLSCGNGAGQCVVSMTSIAEVTLTAEPVAGHFFAGWAGDCSGDATTTVQVHGRRTCAALFEPIASAAPRTLFFWRSEEGEFIGDGGHGMQSPQNSRWTVTSTPEANLVAVRIVTPTTAWRATFSAAFGARLTPGVYPAARNSSIFNGFSIAGNSRACNTSTGRFVVLEVDVAPDGAVRRLAVDFEQHCGEFVPALFGSIRYNATVDSVAPFDGAYPVYALSIAPPTGGRVRGTGLHCGGGATTCDLSLLAAAEIELTATPDFGYSFDGWTGDCSGGRSTTVHVNGRKQCGASFVRPAIDQPRTLWRVDVPPNPYWRSQVFSPANSVWTVEKLADAITVRTVGVGPDSESKWSIVFWLPGGSFGTGRFEDDGSGQAGLPRLSLSGDDQSCSGGEFTIHEYAPGLYNTVARFAATFFVLCGSQRLAVTGSVQYNSTVDLPHHTITLDPSVLRFAAVRSGNTLVVLPAPQKAALELSTDLAWVATTDQPWIQVSPASGKGSMDVTIRIGATGLNPAVASAAGRVTFRPALGGQASGAVDVILTVHGAGQTQAPFGVIDTPLDNRTGVTGAIPMTGWALDDVEVESVTICRAPVAGEVAPVDPNCGGVAQIYVGPAVFIEGARPDVQTGFSTYPRAHRAGWGSMILTNMLPNQGNGTYQFTVYARDREGQSSVLGTRTMTVDNAGASFPFGTIDTPGQGETISGAAYTNFGWVLTQQPKMVPPDGSTLAVYIDGVAMGQISYGHYRADIAALFPGYANSNGAVGYHVIDPMSLANGLHTIVWVATDSAGQTSGLGSRFFRVSNGGANATAAGSASVSAQDFASLPVDRRVLMSRRGWQDDAAWRRHDGSGEPPILRGEELDRFELDLGASAGESISGYLRVGRELRPLPVGSRLDAAGRFVWSPGAGFVGSYDFVFLRRRGPHPITRREIQIVIRPKGSGFVGAQVTIDVPVSQQEVEQPFGLGGWAVDLDSTSGTGIDLLHVWAYPLGGGPPVFVGAATYGGARPDVAVLLGERFQDAGFGLTVSGLAPGQYDLAVFPWSAVSGGFAPAQLVRVTVR